MVIRTQKYKKIQKKKYNEKRKQIYSLYFSTAEKGISRYNAFVCCLLLISIGKSEIEIPGGTFSILTTLTFQQLPKYIFKHIVPHRSLLAINFMHQILVSPWFVQETSTCSWKWTMDIQVFVNWGARYIMVSSKKSETADLQLSEVFIIQLTLFAQNTLSCYVHPTWIVLICSIMNDRK